MSNDLATRYLGHTVTLQLKWWQGTCTLITTCNEEECQAHPSQVSGAAEVAAELARASRTVLNHAPAEGTA